MSRLPAGTRVRLRSIVVASMAHNHRRLPIDWANRRGVVESCTSSVARIIWDGRQSSDPWPRQAVEKDVAHDASLSLSSIEVHSTI
jgi:uncharacterized protein YfiM (DUF2279 family)